MITLGAQLQPQQYAAFRQAMAKLLPGLAVQTINAGGKFAVNGRLTTDQVAAIHRTSQPNGDAARHTTHARSARRWPCDSTEGDSVESPFLF